MRIIAECRRTSVWLYVFDDRIKCTRWFNNISRHSKSNQLRILLIEVTKTHSKHFNFDIDFSRKLPSPSSPPHRFASKICLFFRIVKQVEWSAQTLEGNEIELSVRSAMREHHSNDIQCLICLVTLALCAAGIFFPYQLWHEVDMCPLVYTSMCVFTRRYCCSVEDVEDVEEDEEEVRKNHMPDAINLKVFARCVCLLSCAHIDKRIRRTKAIS